MAHSIPWQHKFRLYPDNSANIALHAHLAALADNDEANDWIVATLLTAFSVVPAKPAESLILVPQAPVKPQVVPSIASTGTTPSYHPAPKPSGFRHKPKPTAWPSDPVSDPVYADPDYEDFDD